jgi:hypothetical protein
MNDRLNIDEFLVDNISDRIKIRSLNLSDEKHINVQTTRVDIAANLQPVLGEHPGHVCAPCAGIEIGGHRHRKLI